MLLQYTMDIERQKVTLGGDSMLRNHYLTGQMGEEGRRGEERRGRDNARR